MSTDDADTVAIAAKIIQEMGTACGLTYAQTVPHVRRLLDAVDKRERAKMTLGRRPDVPRERKRI